jgi:hypothetical protein
MGRFQRATKKRAKLRMAVFGPAGSGKTMTSLRVAAGLGGRVALVDSERGSASKYADRFEFDCCDLGRFSVEEYVAAIREAGAAGYGVLVIDSLSHAWQELLAEVEQLAQAKFRGNTWSAWSVGTPKQRALVDAILGFPGHVIATMRSKTEWTAGDGGGGKSKPVRVGLAPEQGKGIEYEFDLLLEMSVDHQGSVLKDRSGRFQDRLVKLPGEEFGRELAAWLDQGEAPAPAARALPREPDPEPEDDRLAPLDWWSYAESELTRRRGPWLAECRREGVDPPPESLKLLSPEGVHALTNALATWATGTTPPLIDPESVLDDAGRARDRARAWEAARGLYDREPDRVEAWVARKLGAKLDGYRVALGLPTEAEAEEPIEEALSH